MHNIAHGRICQTASHPTYHVTEHSVIMHTSVTLFRVTQHTSVTLFSVTQHTSVTLFSVTQFPTYRVTPFVSPVTAATT